MAVLTNTVELVEKPKGTIVVWVAARSLGEHFAKVYSNQLGLTTIRLVGLCCWAEEFVRAHSRDLFRVVTSMYLYLAEEARRLNLYVAQ